MSGAFPSFETLLMRAAVSGWFDPVAFLREVPEEHIDRLAGELSMLCDERAEAPDGKWMLKAAARRKALESLDRPISVMAALDGAPPVDDDVFGSNLRAVLQGVPLVSSKKHTADADAAAEAEAARHAALQFAGYAPVVNEVKRTAAFNETRARLAAHQQDTELKIVLPDKLFGRQAQLGRIIGFAKGTGPDTRPLLVTGIGGVGKSALLAAAIRRWRRLGFATVVIDFDRPDLTGADPLPIMREILRRLETAWLQSHDRPWTEAALAIRELRTVIASYQEKRSPEANAEEQQRFLLSAVISRLKEGIPESIRREPLLLVFDSFEVVGVLGAEVVHRLLDLTDFMQTDGGCSGLRIVVSGRAVPLSEKDTLSRDGRPIKGALETFGPSRRRIHIQGLGEKEGAAFLAHIDKQQRFPELKVRLHIAKALRGHPLALMVLERFARKRPESEIETIVSDLESQPDFSAEFAQSFLYTRILDRISDPDVEQLAHPGLVLRRVTPDLIRLILAEPCGLQAVDAERAQVLLEKLASEYWLVERLDVGVLRHRPDLRRLMLPGLFAKPRPDDNLTTKTRKLQLRKATLAVCDRAARYYEEGPLPQDPGRSAWEKMPRREREAEATYYRALFGDAPSPELASTMAADLRDYLGADFETLPLGWRAVTRASLGNFAGLSGAERNTLSGPLREQAEAANIDIKIRTGQGLDAASSAERETARRAATRRPVPRPEGTGTQAPTASRPSGGKVFDSPASKEAQPTAGTAPIFSTTGPMEGGDGARFDQVVTSSDLRLQEQRVRAMYTDAHLEGAQEIAAQVISQYALGNVSETTQKQALSGQLWATGLWESALVLVANDKAASVHVSVIPPTPEGFSPLLSASTWILLASLLGHSREAPHDQLQDFLATNRFDGRLASIDGLRFALLLLHELGDLPSGLSRTVELSTLALAESSFIERLKTDQPEGMPPFLEFDRGAKELRVLLDDDLTLATLERLYLSEVRTRFPDREILQDETARTALLEGVIGLTPEIYVPVGRVMQRLDPAKAARVTEVVAMAAPYWPVDLWVIQESTQEISDRPRNRRPYQPQLAASIVQTADRCGVLDRLLLELARHLPEANMLFRMHSALTSRVLFSSTNRTIA